MSRIDELAERRAAIVERCNLQRARMIECGEDFRRSMSGVQRVVDVTRDVASKPLVLAAIAGVVVLVSRPRGLLAWVSRGLFVGGLVQQVARLIAHRRKKSLPVYPPARLAG